MLSKKVFFPLHVCFSITRGNFEKIYLYIFNDQEDTIYKLHKYIVTQQESSDYIFLYFFYWKFFCFLHSSNEVRFQTFGVTVGNRSEVWKIDSALCSRGDHRKKKCGLENWFCASLRRRTESPDGRVKRTASDKSKHCTNRRPQT